MLRELSRKLYQFMDCMPSAPPEPQTVVYSLTRTQDTPLGSTSFTCIGVTLTEVAVILPCQILGEALAIADTSLSLMIAVQTLMLTNM